jgi:group I intron endonuclease
MLVYKWTNIKNGKVYVGQTTQTLKQRVRNHVNNAAAGSMLPIHCAIRKYGLSSFTIEEIAKTDTLDGLNALEVHYIELLSCQVPLGYNLNGGGHNHNQHPETRAKISKAAKKRVDGSGAEQWAAIQAMGQAAVRGTLPWNHGKKATEEAKVNQSKAHMGQEPWNKGAETPADVREKQRLAALNRSTGVECVETGKTWVSLEAASRDTGIAAIHIKRLIKSGRQHKKTGFSFKLADNK